MQQNRCSLVLDLVTDVLKGVVSKWLDVSDMVRLDTAVCQRKYRHKYLSCLSDKAISMSRMSLECFQWFHARRISLRSVSILDSEITDQFVLQASAYWRSLLVLDLSHAYNITDAAIKVVSQQCKSLTTLDLRECSLITNKSLYYLSKNCAQLEVVDFTDCNEITDGGLFHLTFGCSGLTSLTLNGCNQLTDKSILYITDCCPLLHSISVGGCPFLTDDTITMLLATSNTYKRIGFYHNDYVTHGAVRKLLQSSQCQSLEYLSLPVHFSFILCSITFIALRLLEVVSVKGFDCDMLLSVMQAVPSLKQLSILIREYSLSTEVFYSIRRRFLAQDLSYLKSSSDSDYLNLSLGALFSPQ